jgi:hypothetical protein
MRRMGAGQGRAVAVNPRVYQLRGPGSPSREKPEARPHLTSPSSVVTSRESPLLTGRHGTARLGPAWQEALRCAAAKRALRSNRAAAGAARPLGPVLAPRRALGKRGRPPPHPISLAGQGASRARGARPPALGKAVTRKAASRTEPDQRTLPTPASTPPPRTTQA